MTKTDKATTIIKLLKKGYSPKEITERVAVSYNYAWKLKKDLENAAKEVLTEVKAKAGEYIVVEGAKSTQEIDAILNERATTYGSFKDVAEFAQEMKNTIRMCNNSEFDDDQIEALDMIASKIARIVNGDPHHVDSWVDIAGYATLVADRLQGKVR
jgi:DNA-binding CsgD family transcriptional regulator